MEWTRSETIALAKHTCTHCHGLGLRLARGTDVVPCRCVLREVFRECYTHFRECATKEKHISRVSLERRPGGGRTTLWGRKDEEYAADFVLISRRTLDAEDYRLFKFHFLLGADWRLCCRRLGIERGAFFHAVYRIEAVLGQVFRELQPYALFPIDQYYGVVRCDVHPEATADVPPGVTELPRKRGPRITVPLSRPA